MSTKQLKYEPDPNKFDLRTHVWDAQGKLVAKNLYRSFIIEGHQYFERPVNSGNLWYENNKPAGRVEYEFGQDGKISKKRFDFEAQHKAYTPPLTGSEKLYFELEQQRDENERLRAELAKTKSGDKVLASVVEGFPNGEVVEQQELKMRGKRKD